MIWLDRYTSQYRCTVGWYTGTHRCFGEEEKKKRRGRADGGRGRRSGGGGGEGRRGEEVGVYLGRKRNVAALALVVASGNSGDGSGVAKWWQQQC